MEFAKLDAGLACALSDASASPEQEYVVSVRTARSLTANERQEFQQLGGVGVDSRLPVLSAKVTRANLELLSEKPWVQRLTLSRRLSPA
jgi:hypothetical protein